MTDDRDHTHQDFDTLDWDAALHNAFADLVFGGDGGSYSAAGADSVTGHAGFEALMFAPDGAGSAADAASVQTWVANDDTAPAGFGRIMFLRETETSALHQLTGVLDPDSPQINANTVIASGRAANDNAIWIGSSDDGHGDGVFGRDPSVAVLDNGDALIAWIGTDDAIHARFMPAEDGASGSDTGSSLHQQQLDELLVGLGEAAASAGSKVGRVVVTPVGPSSFAALWTSQFALDAVLMGTILTLSTSAHADSKDGDRDDVTLSITDIPAQSIPAGAGAFSVAVTDNNTLTVTYQAEADQGDGSGASAHVTVIHADTGAAATFQTAEFLSDETSTSESHSAPASSAVAFHHHAGDAAQDPSEIVSSHLNADKGIDGSHGAAGNDAHSASSDHNAGKTVIVTDDGNVITGQFVNGVYEITQQDAQGHQTAPVIVITDAIAQDSDHPALDVAPTIAVTDSGIAVAYVTQSGDGAEEVKTVEVQAFDGDGKPLSSDPVTVATCQGPDQSFSDITTGYSHRDADTDSTAVDSAPAANTVHAAEPAASPVEDAGGVLAVAFVENATPDGFGTLKAQLFFVPDPSSDGSSASHEDRGLVALGADGHAGGDNDAVFLLTSSDEGGARAPVMEDMDHGTLAVAWVQQTEHGSGPDVVRGVIMTPGEGIAPEVLDLSPFISNGVAAGTEPVLASDAAGDLIVGWIQAALAGGYEAESAIFKHDGHNVWVPPKDALSLGHYDDIPHDFAIALSGSGDNLTVVVAWRQDDNSVSTARYDVDASQFGQTTLLHASDNHGSDSHTADVNLASLSDGQVLIVYGNGDNSISTTIVQPSSESHDDTSANNSGHDSSGSGDSGKDTGQSSDGHAGSGGSDVPPPAQDVDSVAPLTLAFANFASDLIEFVSAQDAGAPAADAGSVMLPAPAIIEIVVPTAQDVAAMEAMAVAPPDTAFKSSNSGRNSGDGSGSESSGGGSSSGGKSIDDSSSQHGSSDSGSSGSGHDSGDKSGSGSGHHSSSESQETSAHNDNASVTSHDAPLAIASGYGNDIADYISPDEQAALIPEPVSVLFEALQFANAFNDAANSDIMLFDSSNVVTISQFKLPDLLDPRHDIPLT